jgi:hypothetical protein
MSHASEHSAQAVQRKIVSVITPPRRDATTHPVMIAIVQALLADDGVNGTNVVGYAGVGTRVYNTVNLNPDISGKGGDFPYIVVTCPANSVPYAYGVTRLNAQFDITCVDRQRTPNNINGGSQNVEGVISAAYARLVNEPLTATGYVGMQCSAAVAPMEAAYLQAGVVYRQARFTLRVQASWTG